MHGDVVGRDHRDLRRRRDKIAFVGSGWGSCVGGELQQRTFDGCAMMISRSNGVYCMNREGDEHVLLGFVELVIIMLLWVKARSVCSSPAEPE